MIQQNWPSDNNKFCLFANIKSPSKKKFRIVASDKKVNSKYADRIIEVQGERDIYLSFPVSPKELALTVTDMANPTGTDFQVTWTEGKIRSNTWLMDSETISFVQMAIVFSQVCGFTTPPANSPKQYVSSDDLYTINYYDVIRDAKGNSLGTPARIGHSTGRIDVSKVRFDKYTIPMRIIILLHEYSHVFKNPKQGRPIEDETNADLNALHIYLSLGFSKVDAISVFANVFYSAQNEQNINRMRVIMNYIREFEDDHKIG